MEPGGFSHQGPSTQEQIYTSPGPPPYGAPQPYGYPAPGAPYPPPRNTNGLALAAMIVGIAGIIVPFASIAAIVLGHLGLSAVKRTGEEGRGYALAGAILGWVITGLYLLFILFYILLFTAAFTLSDLPNQ